MNMPTLITDNIAEVLIKIIEFTQVRQKILARNINNIHTGGFMPEDLEVDEFSEVLHDAICEHTRSRRLLLRDTENIKFGAFGSFEVKPTIDKYAEEILERSLDEYLELQINKLLENAINQRVAAELLRQRERTVSIFE